MEHYQVFRKTNGDLIKTTDVLACYTDDLDVVPPIDGACVVGTKIYSGVYKFSGLEIGYYYFYIDHALAMPPITTRNKIERYQVDITIPEGSTDYTVYYSAMIDKQGRDIPVGIIQTAADVSVEIITQTNGRGAYLSSFDKDKIVLNQESVGSDLDSKITIEIVVLL